MDKITLKDIAKDSGYSVSTVSRVLNGFENISNDTKEKVFRSATKLKYPAWDSINREKKSSFLKIALIVSGFHIGEFYASFYRGFTKAAEEYDILLSIVCNHEPKKNLFQLTKELSASNEGLILFTPEYDRNDYLELQKILPDDYPIVSNGLIENPVFSTITFDGYSGGYMAAKHFNKKGYRNCGAIKGPLDKAESRFRFNGYRDFITQNSSMEFMWKYEGDFSFESGTKAFWAYQKSKQKPRAIFACNDEMCHAFMEAAKKAGYRFPDDIAIIGFDDLPICQRHQPRISSITAVYRKLGRITLENLQNSIKKPKKQKGVLSFVPVSLTIRESS